MNNICPLVSVIISTRNEEDVIEDLLKSVRSQTYPNIELILVDNKSADHTVEIANFYVDKLVIQGPERSAQRNRGVQEARGKYVLILDADMRLSPRVVKDLVACVINDSSIKAVVIPEKSFGYNYWARCKALERNCYTDNLKDVTGARFYDKELFLRIGGFDEKMTGTEDWDLSQRVARVAKVGSIQSVIIHNEGHINLFDQMRKKYYYALTLRGYIKRHPAAFFRQANFLFRPAYFRHWRDLVRHPHLAAGMFFLRLSEAVAGAVGVLLGVLQGKYTGSFGEDD
ncbi:MAG: glycosyltransferase family 2 protein [Candidatus Helarchaeota archaeon]